MDSTRFSLTYDYRCPFARNAHEHVVTAIQAGAPFDVQFVPFVLGGAGGTDGKPLIWQDPSQRPSLVAMAASIVIRDRFPEKFLDAHLALFRFRHDHAGDLRSEVAIRNVLGEAGIDVEAVFTELEAGWPYEVLQRDHENAVLDHEVWGVPTFIANDQAAFVRLMNKPDGNAKAAINTVETVLSLLYTHVEINEFKHTSVPY